MKTNTEDKRLKYLSKSRDRDVVKKDILKTSYIKKWEGHILK